MLEGAEWQGKVAAGICGARSLRRSCLPMGRISGPPGALARRHCARPSHGFCHNGE